MKNIIHKHWTKGGHGITNFNKDELSIYKAALIESGCSNLVIDSAMYPLGSSSSYFGLYNIDGREGDLSNFWAVFRVIKKRKQESEVNTVNNLVKCKCSSFDLFHYGCKCGAFELERDKKM